MKNDKVKDALAKTISGFKKSFPDIVGVLLLVGIFLQLNFEEVGRFFTGNSLLDALTGGLLGSFAAGNPVTSYIIGGELLDKGVSLIAVTAFLLSWVTVGLVQLPAEILIMGRKFALVRNLSSFVLAIAVAFAVVITIGAIK
jgi:uncharacterized membrane protein YraQ (UPF0718 family)